MSRAGGGSGSSSGALESLPDITLPKRPNLWERGGKGSSLARQRLAESTVTYTFDANGGALCCVELAQLCEGISFWRPNSSHIETCSRGVRAEGEEEEEEEEEECLANKARCGLRGSQWHEEEREEQEEREGGNEEDSDKGGDR
ncbi:unnamed protein product [Pleuronectes platessa]|uniref:Uncharacterized protein n=1 Tax=Pleuronectes platessa TaxID=8262 RepID=A0A9N7TKC7_PLEPL|nr:unnamed protein product [Pleuronectes platessa]